MDKHVLVVGGGFGGVYATRALLRAGFNVTMVSATNYFVFYPLLHEVATGGLHPSNIVFEYSSFFRSPRFTFFRETVTEIDLKKRVATTSDGEKLSYNFLIYGTGSSTNFFNTPGSEHALTLKSIDDALEIKKRVIHLAQGIERHVVINIVGGGPTGVELSLELHELLMTIKRNSPRLSFTIRLLHAEETLLSFFPEATQKYALKTLEKRGAEVHLDTFVTEIRENGVTTKAGEEYAGDITIWTAGVVPNSHLVHLSYKDENDSVVVNRALQIKGREREFAVGDVISMKGVDIPKLGQTAIKEGELAARNICAIRDGKKLLEYEPKLSGKLISLGRWRGSGEVFGIPVKGLIGWIIWRTAYLIKTPGLSNKLEVFFTWTGNLISSRDTFEG